MLEDNGIAICCKAESEDALLLREMAHRVGNDLGVAQAALRLVSGCGNDGWRSRLLGEALHRLDSAGEVHRLLARPLPISVDVAAQLDALCRALVGACPEASNSRVTLDLPGTWVDGGMARRVSLIAAELVTNAVRHALSDHAGSLHVSLRTGDGRLVLTVENDGIGSLGRAATSGTGLGRGIVAGLVATAGGALSAEVGAHGTSVRVVLPMGGTELREARIAS